MRNAPSLVEGSIDIVDDSWFGKFSDRYPKSFHGSRVEEVLGGSTIEECEFGLLSRSHNHVYIECASMIIRRPIQVQHPGNDRLRG